MTARQIVVAVTDPSLPVLDGGMPLFLSVGRPKRVGVAGGSPGQDAPLALETLRRSGASTEGMEL